MTISINELKNSRDTQIRENGIQSVRTYEIGVADPDLAVALLAGQIGPGGEVFAYGAQHPFFVGSYLQDIKVKHLEQYCRVSVVWGPDEVDDPENEFGEVWSWDYGTANQHITSVARVKAFGVEGSDELDDTNQQIHWPRHHDIGGAIGVDGSDVVGADVLRPSSTMKVRKTFDTVTKSEHQKFRDAQACINEKEFSTIEYPARTLLFEGATVDAASRNRFYVTYNFQIANEQVPSNVDIERADNTKQTVTVNMPPQARIWFRHVDKIILQTPAEGPPEKIKRTAIQSLHIYKPYTDFDFDDFGLQGP